MGTSQTSDEERLPLVEVSGINFEKWKRKRKFTFIIYIFQYFLTGVETSINLATLWIFATTLMNTDSPETFYGLINAAFYLPTILFAPVIARYADRTRKIKLCLMIGNGIVMLGGILYVIPFSPYYAVCGRFLQGFIVTMKPLMVGEIVRSYQSGEIQYKLPILTIAQHLGYSLAPVAAIFLQSINFWIGSIDITYANITGLIVFGSVMILQLLITLCVHDLSSEFDLKETEFNETDINIRSSFTSIVMLKDVFTHWQTLLMIAITLVCELPSLIRALPVFIMAVLHYSESVVNISFVCYGVISIIIALVLVTRKVSPKGSYYFGIFSLIALMIILPIMLTLSMNISNYGLNVTLLSLVVILLCFFRLGETIFTQITMAKLTRSSNQTYVESIRVIVRNIGEIIGALLTVCAMFNLLPFCLITLIITSFLVFILARKSASLINPTPVI